MSRPHYTDALLHRAAAVRLRAAWYRLGLHDVRSRVDGRIVMPADDLRNAVETFGAELLRLTADKPSAPTDDGPQP